MKDKIKGMEERNKWFWEDTEEGWIIIKKVGRGILSLIVIILAAPLALIGAFKRELKKWMK